MKIEVKIEWSLLAWRVPGLQEWIAEKNYETRYLVAEDVIAIIFPDEESFLVYKLKFGL